jgi:hypothetical protein
MQNVKIWSDTNAHSIQQMPLDGEKIGISCAEVCSRSLA